VLPLQQEEHDVCCCERRRPTSLFLMLLLLSTFERESVASCHRLSFLPVERPAQAPGSNWV